MDVIPGPVEQVDIDHLAHPLAVQRTVPVGSRHALCIFRHRNGPGQELLIFRLLQDAPHLQKLSRQRTDCLALQHHGGILPAAMLLDVIDVLIGKIHAAGKTDPPVNDKNFPVVAVIIVSGDERLHRAEHLALNVQLLQQPGVVAGQGGELTGAVVHHPDIHALQRLAGQHFQDLAPHQALVDDEILHKDIFFCRFQLAQQFLKLCLTAGEVGHGGVLVHRKAAAPPIQVLCQRGCAGFKRFQLFHGLLALRQPAAQLVLQLQQPFAQDVVPEIALDIEEHRNAHHRRNGNHHHPGDLGAVVHLAVEQVDDHGRCNDHAAAEVMGPQVAEPPEDAEQQPHLQQQEDQHQAKAAEDGVDHTLLPLSQQPQAAVLKLMNIALDVLFQFLCFHVPPFLFPPQGHRIGVLCRVAALHQLLGLGADPVVMPRVIEPVVFLIVAHQQ